ncbi:MAG: UvrD-helicase domain-containing protein, partial [Treponema sp.]|nr:UvrD-helicase domain-containing protein [Treponema sp.]
MKIIADIHIHSPWSRATSSRISPASLERWAGIKGIGLLGTGDCTHPKWIQELRDNLEDAQGGFYKLKEKARLEFDAGPALAEGLPLPAGNQQQEPNVRFVLSGEISTIYKKAGKTRKVHHVVVLPDFKAAAVFGAKLERLGNIRSDGRPILGLDSENLLSLLLETDDRALLIPAHIWTPWFSVLGAKSGFDSIEECYGSLASHIPAVETGLSSNPPMNWALSGLDRYSIISNSDAHSPDKLGREATIFEMELSYDSFRRALYNAGNSPESAFGRTGIAATVEFFPQEGKYHYDGHRNCGICLDPEEAARLDGTCPVCGKPLTRGVMGRVLELADRPVDETAPCPDEQSANRRPYYSLIPLKEILGELLETGGASKKVEAAYGALVEKAGNEFAILLDMAPDKIEALSCPGISGELLAKAICRMRRGEVSITPGYDGEYGVIRTFSAGESKESGTGLFEENIVKNTNTKKKPRQAKQNNAAGVSGGDASPANGKKPPPPDRGFSLDEDQLAAVSSDLRKGIIIAGPGTGKTAVLAAKIARVISEGANPAAGGLQSVLAISFTVKAAAELRDRVFRITHGLTAEKPVVATFHSLCASILREQYAAAGLPADFKILSETERDELLAEIAADNKGISPKRLGEYIEERKRYVLLPGEKPEDLSRVLPASLVSLIPEDNAGNAAISNDGGAYAEYRKRLLSLGAVDYDGLIAGTARLLAMREDIRKYYCQRFCYIFVDEYQDINFAQYALIRLLAGNEENSPSLWVIGDPNQAIYGFRGSDKAFIDRFRQDYPGAGYFELRKSFRCAGPIIVAAGRLTAAGCPAQAELKVADVTPSAPVSLFRREYPTEKSEAEGIARIIASLVGGTSFFALDSKTTNGAGLNPSDFSPSDCAVLVRAAALAEPVAKALNDHGIPFEIAGAQVWWEEEPVKTLLENLRTQKSEDIRAVWDSMKTKEKKSAPPETVEHLIRLAALFGNTQSLLDNLSAGQGLPDTPREGVRVMTIHAAKGLEFDHVFVAGLEEGILPFTLYNETPDIEEERRLLYVAMTRARRGLWLSYSA